MITQNKFSILISILLFFIPVVTFLNEINLPQILNIDIYVIILSQIFLLLITFLISLFIHKNLLNNFISFRSFFLINSVYIYLLFYFKNAKYFFYTLHEKYFLIDDILVILIYIFFYCISLRLEKKLFNFLLRFVSIYIILQLSLFSYNFYNFKLSPKKSENSQKNIEKLSYLNIDLIKKDSKEPTIFFIVLDGMMNLEYAEKLGIISSKNKVIDKLKKNNLVYKNNFFTNYNVTYLSIASLLQGSYPVIESSKKYNNRDNFFPAFILNQRKDNNFFKILRKTNKKFYWLGSQWAYCQNNNYIKCIDSKGIYKFVSKIRLFYYDSIFIHLFNLYPSYNSSSDSINFLINFEKKFNDNEIYLIHVLSPHPPYFFDNKCNIQNNLQVDNNSENHAIVHYSNAYNCLLDIISKLTGKIDDISKNNMVFILGDHGWSFGNKIMKKNNIDPEESRFSPFFSYKVPSQCENINSPKSIVNILRFALICGGNTDLRYLQDIKFKTFYEHEPNFGKVFKRD